MSERIASLLFYFVLIFIQLVVLGLSCGTWDLQPLLLPAGSLVEAQCGIWFPD